MVVIVLHIRSKTAQNRSTNVYVCWTRLLDYRWKTITFRSLRFRTKYYLVGELYLLNYEIRFQQSESPARVLRVYLHEKMT